jgi:hypothetical protein
VRPVTTPPPVILATVGSLLLQIPPGAELERVIVVLKHTLVGPEMVPDTGNGFTIIVCVVEAIPHILVTTYPIVSWPALTPVTKPPTTVADELLVVHTPPGAGLVRVMLDASQTLVGPEIVPATGVVSTVMLKVAIAVPQILVTE